MRKYLFIIPVLAGVLVSCDTKLYEDCPPERIVGEWGVVNDTHTFGEYDSLYYLINPIGNITDSIYYNGNYTDSYYNSDPVRVTLRYTLGDSIYLNLDRQYATQTNPPHLILIVSDMEHPEKDSVENISVLHLKRNVDDGNLYSAAPDSAFRRRLIEGKELFCRATNSSSSSEAEGSQNYEFRILPSGFEKAYQMADSLSGKIKIKPLHKKS